MAEDNTRHSELATLLFDHAMAMIESNDRRYLSMFVTHVGAAGSHAGIEDRARAEMLRVVDVLRESYLIGHTDVVKKIEALQSNVDSNKGSDAGVVQFAGWLFAGLTLLAAVGMHFIEPGMPQDPPQSIANGQELLKIMAQTQVNSQQNLAIISELEKHDLNVSREAQKECQKP